MVVNQIILGGQNYFIVVQSGRKLIFYHFSNKKVFLCERWVAIAAKVSTITERERERKSFKKEKNCMTRNYIITIAIMDSLRIPNFNDKNNYGSFGTFSQRP